jgi:hypothetical protein
VLAGFGEPRKDYAVAEVARRDEDFGMRQPEHAHVKPVEGVGRLSQRAGLRDRTARGGQGGAQGTRTSYARAGANLEDRRVTCSLALDVCR